MVEVEAYIEAWQACIVAWEEVACTEAWACIVAWAVVEVACIEAWACIVAWVEEACTEAWEVEAYNWAWAEVAFSGVEGVAYKRVS